MIKKYNITVNGNSYEVEVEEIGSEGVQVSRAQSIQQSTPKMPPKEANNSASKLNTQSGGSGTVSAPMPGTINDVKVKIGDSVKKGQVLLVLEAMKMENEIMASVDGNVTSVNVSKGASVSVGDTLITIG
ncbi:MAG: biotin/lipoyl-binding protein [Clostridioides difficile]|nr:biotin/lipoyl-binding protein [Clostridioides difficile]